MPGPDIFISAGEASGEHYGALLLSSLKRRLEAQGRQAAFFGMGGPRMAAEGLEIIVRSEDMAVMGITEVVRHLPRIYREFRRLKQTLRRRRPSVAVLIDFPDIHFKLAEQLHAQGVPVIFFVSPQLWAWKKHRIRLVRKYVDKMLVIFPFEEQFYLSRGVNAEFVGHPLADLHSPSITRQEFAALHHLDPAKSWIALLPGSRAKEIRDNLPEMLAAARLLVAAPDLPGADPSPFRRAHSETSTYSESSLHPQPSLHSEPIAHSNPGTHAQPSPVTGHEFTRAESAAPSPEALAPKSAISNLEGTGFSPYINPPHEQGALAPKSAISNLEGTGFSPYINPPHEQGALAPGGFEFIVPLAPTLNASRRAFVARLIAQHGAGLPIHLISDMRAEGADSRTAGAAEGSGARAALFHARASVVASGTATLEAALIGNPFVVVYRVSPITYAIAKRVVTVPHIAMANLIAGSRVVPELIQNNFTARNIVQHIAPLLPDGAPRESMMQELGKIRILLSSRNQISRGMSSDAIERVADIVLDQLGLTSPVTVSVPS